MEFEIKDIFEKGNELRVVVEHKYGIDSFGFSLDKKKLDPETDEPKFLTEIKRHLNLKYGDKTKKTNKVFTDLVGKKYKL